MIKETITVVHPDGLHLRPASYFAKEMSRFQSDVYIQYKNFRVNGKSIFSIIPACIKCGSQIDIECEGPDETDAMTRATEIIKLGLTE